MVWSCALGVSAVAGSISMMGVSSREQYNALKVQIPVDACWRMLGYDSVWQGNQTYRKIFLCCKAHNICSTVQMVCSVFPSVLGTSALLSFRHVCKEGNIFVVSLDVDTPKRLEWNSIAKSSNLYDFITVRVLQLGRRWFPMHKTGGPAKWPCMAFYFGIP